MKKVLMVGNSPSVKGGITTVIEQFRCFEFCKENIKLKFIATYKDSNNMVKILYFALAYIRILTFIIFKKPDIIHIHMSYRGSFTRAYIIQKLAIRFNIKNIIHLHGSEFKKWYNSINIDKKTRVQELLRRANKFIVLGNEWNKIIKEIEPLTQTIVLNNSVKIPSTIAQYEERKTILFLGVLIKRKGVQDLIEALAHLTSDNYEVLIAGSGEEQKHLEQLTQKNKIKNIRFLGWINAEEKNKLLNKAQFMVLPTYNEGLPMSILEAMSYGVPVISTYVGDIPSVIENNKNGFLYESGNIIELEKKLKDAIDMDKNSWTKLSTNARKSIEEFYSENAYFEKIVQLYNE